jgi:hypothetical protein
MEVSKAYHEFLREENHILRNAVVTLRAQIKAVEAELDRLRYIDDMENNRDKVEEWEDLPF